MKKTVYRIFMAWDSDKEEQWLNEMSAKGKQLVGTSRLHYTFEDGKAGKYVYRLELLEQAPGHPKSVEYLRFLGETGVEYIDSCIRWVYLRRKASEGPFDLYSDIHSRIKQTDRILTLLVIASSMFLFSVATMLLNHSRFQSDFKAISMRVFFWAFLSSRFPLALCYFAA